MSDSYEQAGQRHALFHFNGYDRNDINAPAQAIADEYARVLAIPNCTIALQRRINSLGNATPEQKAEAERTLVELVEADVHALGRTYDPEAKQYGIKSYIRMSLLYGFTGLDSSASDQEVHHMIESREQYMATLRYALQNRKTFSQASEVIETLRNNATPEQIHDGLLLLPNLGAVIEMRKQYPLYAPDTLKPRKLPLLMILDELSPEANLQN